MNDRVGTYAKDMQTGQSNPTREPADKTSTDLKSLSCSECVTLFTRTACHWFVYTFVWLSILMRAALCCWCVCFVLLILGDPVRVHLKVESRRRWSVFSFFRSCWTHSHSYQLYKFINIYIYWSRMLCGIYVQYLFVCVCGGGKVRVQ